MEAHFPQETASDWPQLPNHQQMQSQKKKNPLITSKNFSSQTQHRFGSHQNMNGSVGVIINLPRTARRGRLVEFTAHCSIIIRRYIHGGSIALNQMHTRRVGEVPHVAMGTSRRQTQIRDQLSFLSSAAVSTERKQQSCAMSPLWCERRPP